MESRTIYRMTHIPPSAILLVVQLAALVFYAVFDGLHDQRVLISVIGALVVVLMVWVVIHSPGPNWIAWTLAIPAFILSLVSAAAPVVPVLAAAALLSAALYFYAAGSLIAYMLGDTRVTIDELFATGATFTLLAWGYAYLYQVCQAWVPNSFASSLVDRPLTFVELLSLSFTNLSATGLSDIVAASPWARVLVMLEQFSGVMYITIVVSRLVGLLGVRQEHRTSQVEGHTILPGTKEQHYDG